MNNVFDLDFENLSDGTILTDVTDKNGENVSFNFGTGKRQKRGHKMPS